MTNAYQHSERRPGILVTYIQRGALKIRVCIRRHPHTSPAGEPTFTHSIEVKGTDGAGDPCWVPMRQPPPDILIATMYCAINAANGWGQGE
jgi:hypothetical protein